MGFVLQDYQTTLRSRATLTGTGVHSGKPVTVNFLPADADTGVVFHPAGGLPPARPDFEPMHVFARDRRT